MSAATTLSRITGFFRMVAQAGVLGTGVVAQAYTVSNLLPNLIYDLFLGGVLSSIFIPLLVERLSRHGEEDARRMVNALLTVILPLLAAVVALGVVLAGPLINLVTGWGSADLSPEEAQRTTNLAILLFRVFALQILFYGVGALMIGVLNSHRHFFLPTIAPVFNNLTVIASFVGYLMLSGSRPTAAIYLLAAGTTLGVAVMSLMLVPAVLRLGYRPRVRLGHPALRSVLRLAFPVVVFVGSWISVQLFGQFLATQFNAAPQLQYAFTVFQLPYGIFAVAVATALMPELSESFSRGDTDGYRANLSFGLRTVVFILVPAAVAMISLSVPAVGVLYERGEFDPQATDTVAALLSAYGLGLVAYGAYFVLVRSFYSHQNTRTPAAINVGMLGMFVVLAYFLTRLVGLAGVPLAFSAVHTGAALVLLYFMRREIERIDGRRLASSISRILLAGAAMFAAAEFGVSLTGAGAGLIERIAVLVVVGGVSLAVYLGAALLLGVEELRSVLSLLRKRTFTPQDDH